MTGITQAYYTSVKEGPSGHAGFQFVAVSEGFSSANLSAVEKLLGYRAPRGAPPSPSSTELADFPVAEVFERLESGEYAFIRTRYLGADYSGRFGNYFAHVVLVDPQVAPLSLKPLDLFELDWWQDSGEVGSSFPDLDLPTETNNSPVFDSAGTPDQAEVLAAALRQVFEGQHTLYIEDQLNSVKGWLDFCYALIPNTNWWDLTFTTCATDTTRAPGRIRFIDPGEDLQLQPYELRSTVSLVSTVRDSAGPTNPFGRIVGSLAEEDGRESLALLGERIAGSGLRLSGGVMDAIAIASDGDPELHDLSEEETFEAVRLVLKTGDRLFTIRHIGWAFDQFSPDRESEISALFADSLNGEGELAREIARKAFEWLLEKRIPDSKRSRPNVSRLSDEWTEVWFGVLANVDPDDYAKALTNGLVMGLCEKDERASELGVEIASRVAEGRVPIGKLSEINGLPAVAVREMVAFAADHQSDSDVDLSLFRDPLIESEISRQLASTGSLSDALKLWDFSEALGVSLDEKALRHVISLVGSQEEAQRLLIASSGKRLPSFQTQFALIAMSARHGMQPSAEMMAEFEVELSRGKPPSNKEISRLSELYSRLEELGVSTNLGETIMLLSYIPRSIQGINGMIDDTARVVDGPLKGEWREKLMAHVCGFVAATEDPRVHLDLVRSLSLSRNDELEQAYVTQMIDRLDSRKKMASTGALIFLTWNESASRNLGPRNRDVVLLKLNEKQRSKVGDQLSARQARAWKQWCKRNPPRGLFSKRRARR